MKLQFALLLQVCLLAKAANIPGKGADLNNVTQVTCEYMKSVNGDLLPNRTNTEAIYDKAQGSYSVAIPNFRNISGDFLLPIGDCNQYFFVPEGSRSQVDSRVVVGFNGQELLAYIYFRRTDAANKTNEEGFGIVPIPDGSTENFTASGFAFNFTNIQYKNNTTKPPTNDSNALGVSTCFHLMAVWLFML
eukprot:CAMPEP_0203766806 /NCGR_PEP_ID=MMETSP0099_2-20121227/631_1 /ASSEMBLY_ACC=CAM_ASM_000209 /TAXON_ID=96639 /ORGANISM=" , Strain NY0313808BC1" /LENGTH=189 /DNA_ID=CAMNT_0050663215 /DNA_START=93 /DNA_END=658 /DNA_ORIENTATION=+